ncbi:MAG: SMP-30/gluconolactonase/LRE family protein [Thermoanaerobaculia bacterium]
MNLFRFAPLVVVASAPLFAAELPPPDLAAAEVAFAEALAAREAGDLHSYRTKIERAAELLPDPSRLLYRLAGARLLDGDRSGAIEAFGRQVDAGFFRDPRKDAEFAPLLSDSSFTVLLARLDALKEPLVASTVAFEIPRRDLLVEGLAWDAGTKSFCLSSVRQRRILRRSSDGALEELAVFPADRVGSPLGMAVDARQRRLWVAAAGLPQGSAPESLLRRGAVVAIDLATGKLAVEAGPFPSGQSANDLAVAPDGSVYVSDPEAKATVRVGADGSRKVLAEGHGLRSPGGVALSADAKLLYVADWSQGLAVVDVASGALTWMRPPARATVLGIDGLIAHGGSLLAIQNGVFPPRIARLELAADGRSLRSARILERGVPDWDEPTLGVVVDGALHYVAASQWPRYGEDGKPTEDLEKLPYPTVRRLPLD